MTTLTHHRLRGYFLNYQTAFIHDASPLVIVEKGRQIGLSYAAAYKAVRLATRKHARHDVWVMSRDEIRAMRGRLQRRFHQPKAMRGPAPYPDPRCQPGEGQKGYADCRKQRQGRPGAQPGETPAMPERLDQCHQKQEGATQQARESSLAFGKPGVIPGEPGQLGHQFRGQCGKDRLDWIVGGIRTGLGHESSL